MSRLTRGSVWLSGTSSDWPSSCSSAEHLRSVCEGHVPVSRRPEDLSCFSPSAERLVGLTWWAGIRLGRAQVPLKSGHALSFYNTHTHTQSHI